MMMKGNKAVKRGKNTNGPIQKWGARINWGKRVKAVCKPCWEIKYCPYGPLIEDFPLKRERDTKSCRIYGHDCPVFYVAEPFTETKELRNISRDIPRVTQFKVMKRENQICSVCGKSVKDEDVEFDHKIPWSKGGPSEEYNVRLLCSDCNKKRGNNFESEYLVNSLNEHLVGRVGIEILFVLLGVAQAAHIIAKDGNGEIKGLDFSRFEGRRKVRDHDEISAMLFKDITEFFTSKKPREIKREMFDSLKYRWGFSDGSIHKLKESAETYEMDIEELLQTERLFIQRIGWEVGISESVKRKWLHS